MNLLEPYARILLCQLPSAGGRWAYRLDRVEGEIPIEPLNDETYDWQSARMEIAEFNAEEFNTKQFMECFNCSAPTASRSIARLLGDGVIKRIKYGSYHKVLAELP